MFMDILPHGFTQAASNIPRHYTALAEWLSCVVYILLMKKACFSRYTAGIMGGGLLLMLLLQGMAGMLPQIFWILGMLIAFAAMVGFMKACSGMSLKNVIYHAFRAFILAELAASLEWQLYYYFVKGKPADTFPVRTVYIAIIYGLVFLPAYLLEKKMLNDENMVPISKKDLAYAGIISIFVFFLSNLSFLDFSTPFSSSLEPEIFNIRTIVDLAGFVILFAYYALMSELYVRHERDTMEHVLQNQLMQYKLSKESIDLVNRKYHDLKHQIAVLRAESNAEKRNAYLDEMENEIKVHEAQKKTGNEILDTLLTSKSLYCMKHNIGITCVADGTLLSFMDVMDICTVFGNALDNAIECELRISDKEKRLIHMAVFAQKQFLIISIENYCEEEIHLEEGIPLTSKKDYVYHGFGIKSMQYSVQKYGGTLSVGKEKNWFKLVAMIPLP